MDHATQFTQKMHAVIGGVMDRIKTFYCREDLEEKLREVLAQQAQKRSGYGFRLKELSEMCLACGLDPELLLDMQTRGQALAQIPQEMHLDAGPSGFMTITFMGVSDSLSSGMP